MKMSEKQTHRKGCREKIHYFPHNKRREEIREISLNKIGNLSEILMITLKKIRPISILRNIGFHLGTKWTKTIIGKGRSPTDYIAEKGIPCG
jgi:hypothetical protein